MAGIAYIDASGTIDGVEVTGIRESRTPMFGMQRGLGIYVTNSDPSLRRRHHDARYRGHAEVHRDQELDGGGLPEGRYRQSPMPT
jgi:hypothetical protein